MKNSGVVRFDICVKNERIIADLNQEAVELAAKIQKNFEELGA